MKEFGIKSNHDTIDISTADSIFWNLSPAELTEHAIINKEGILADTGALACDTGKFTGRSPDDKFFVKDDITTNSIFWGDINHPIDGMYFDKLFGKMQDFIKGKTLYVHDAVIGASEIYKKPLRVITTKAYHSLFCYNMFLRPTAEELAAENPEYTVLCIPEFEADPATDGVRSKNFAIINLTKKIIIIGGTAYTGEIKKGMFSVLNFELPHYHKVLSMHASANMGKSKDVAIFFGLSGTGKTTLSADPERFLIGDDEHGWDDEGVFNLEGGCYAKAIDLKREEEPEIYDAIRFGSVLENVRFFPGTRKVNYSDSSVTQNTRVSYPIEFIPNSLHPSRGGLPTNIFFLTADAFGVLPPISKLTPAQAMFQFISGYTAKVAGTEEGVNQPKPVFSVCFGAPFMPLDPIVYAQLLGEKMKKHNVNVWLINTGWTGGAYGVGSRIKLGYTRAMITAALEGNLQSVNYHTDAVFGLATPDACPNVPTELLSPAGAWKDKDLYLKTATKLAQSFVKNFDKYKAHATPEMLQGMPVVKSVA